MMGMVFTELLSMVEEKFSMDMVDDIVDRAGARGSYTSVGRSQDGVLVKFVVALGETSGVAVPDLLHAYGLHMFSRFLALYPMFFNSHQTAPSFLAGLESHVHTEVRKLYQVASPPLFTFQEEEDGTYVLDYQSDRGLWQFARGLLEACLEHYGAQYRVQAVCDLSHGAGTHVRFKLERS